jgi:hypothetical protein
MVFNNLQRFNNTLTLMIIVFNKYQELNIKPETQNAKRETKNEKQVTPGCRKKNYTERP